MTEKIHTGSLRHNELEVVYAISRVVAETMDIDIALDRITKLARQVFIFDNAVLYRTQSKNNLEPVFARAIGRGRSTPADITWGDTAAFEVISTGNNYTYHSSPDPEKDRLDQHYLLGLPMLVAGEITGALVFVRFGGPEYSPDQINLAEFIAAHVTHLLERQRLVGKIANLEAERRLARLQEDFIAMVSHELNTPLGFIKGYTTTLLRKDTQWDEETRQDFLQIIDEEADRLVELIENLLDSSRLQARTLNMEFQNISLEEMINNHVERLAILYNNLEIHVEFPDNEVIVQADAKRLGQVLENLVSNASKYAPQSKLTISLNINEQKAHVAIKDEGPGIPPQHLAHIFERFYRVPERSGGVRVTGLGLFIFKEIITAHHGQITVESEINQGTIFHIYLPLAKEVKNE